MNNYALEAVGLGLYELAYKSKHLVYKLHVAHIAPLTDAMKGRYINIQLL